MADIRQTPIANYPAYYGSSLLNTLNEAVSKPFGYENAPVRALTNLFGVPAATKTLENIAYGMPNVIGTGMATQLRPEARETVGNLLPVAPGVAKLATRGLVAGGEYLAPKASQIRRLFEQPAASNFENWFQKSAIVEPSGAPQKMYHATSADIQEFRPGNTIYVSPSPKFAESYGGTQTPNIMPLYVKATKPFNYENPADIQKLAEVYKKLHGEDLFSKKTISSAGGEMKLSQLDKNPISQRLKSGDWTIIEDKKVQDAIKKAGFDAFYIEEGGVKNLGVYDPTQLKSVFNKGEFNPKDPRLLAGALPLLPQQEAETLDYRDPFAPTF